MDFKKNVRNELFKRQEIIVKIESEKNPGFEATKKILSEELSKPEENILINKIKGSFGKKSFIVHANIYDSKDYLEAIKKLAMSKKQKKENIEITKENIV